MRAAVRLVPVAVPVVALAASLAVAAPAHAATAAATSAAAAASASSDPYAPASGHAYRRGAVPTRSAEGAMRGYRAAHPAAAAAASSNLTYGGGVDGIGVTSGTEKVYLVFYGSQWGTAGTNTSGYTTFSGDSAGMAPRVQALFKGLGTNGESWSNVMTQYCEGIAKGSSSCAGATHFVAYPSPGTLAGVWYDNSVKSPTYASGNTLAKEAVKAAGHFGNTTATSNRFAQYVVVSPHGTHPDYFNTFLGNFCAWHDWNGDTGLSGGSASSPYGDIAFTNLPYIPDAGTSCGKNFVNAGTAGNLDGVTIVEGHEYAETITDQNPAGGWTDSSGQENGDKCAWVSSGAGASQDVAFGTGSFAMQSTWSNAISGCAISR